MKSLLVFVLFGATCCLAGPTCPTDEIKKCYDAPYGETSSEEEKLNRECRHINCLLQFPDKCLNGKDYFPRKGYTKFATTFCNKTNPLRRKYLENAACIKKETVSPGSKDLVRECFMTYLSNRDEFCKLMPGWMQCAVDYVTTVCGKDAGTVYRIGTGPYMDIYDCLQ